MALGFLLSDLGVKVQFYVDDEKLSSIVFVTLGVLSLIKNLVWSVIWSSDVRPEKSFGIRFYLSLLTQQVPIFYFENIIKKFN